MIEFFEVSIISNFSLKTKLKNIPSWYRGKEVEHLFVPRPVKFLT